MRGAVRVLMREDMRVLREIRFWGFLLLSYDCFFGSIWSMKVACVARRRYNDFSLTRLLV